MHKAQRMLMGAMILVFLAGCALLAYPFLRGRSLDRAVAAHASSFLERVHPAEKVPVQQDAVTAPPETIEHQALWDAVCAYNAQIWEERQAGLSNSWSYQQSSIILGDFGVEDEIFAVLSIPKIELEMPIYLGATNDHLSLGAAHLSQTSLPVGGINTNCVIAGHRGWHHGEYFYNIVDLEPGDEVVITNMWDTLRYRVTEAKAIESYDVDKVKIQEGRDMVTLLTCYYNGSGHKMRFAVYCVRIHEETTEKEGTE